MVPEMAVNPTQNKFIDVQEDKTAGIVPESKLELALNVVIDFHEDMISGIVPDSAVVATENVTIDVHEANSTGMVPEMEVKLTSNIVMDVHEDNAAGIVPEILRAYESWKPTKEVIEEKLSGIVPDIVNGDPASLEMASHLSVGCRGKESSDPEMSTLYMNNITFPLLALPKAATVLLCVDEGTPCSVCW